MDYESNYPPVSPHSHNGIDSPLIDKVANGITSGGGGTTSSAIVGRMHGGGTSIANTTDTKVPFGTMDIEQGITVDLTNHRFTALTAGYYFIDSTVYYDSPTANKNYVTELYINNDTGTQKAYNIYIAPNSTIGGGRIFGIVYLAVGEFAEIYTFHNTGGASTLSNGYPYVYAEIFKIS